MSSRCERRTLATHASFQIEQCGCGTLHVSFGPFTLRLPHASVRALHGALTQALATLRKEQEHTATLQ